MPLRYPWDALHTQLKAMQEFQNYRILSPFTVHAYLWTTFISFSYAFMFGKSIYLASASLPQGAFLLTTSCSGAKPHQLWKNSQEANEHVGALAFWLKKKTWSSCTKDIDVIIITKSQTFLSYHLWNENIKDLTFTLGCFEPWWQLRESWDVNSLPTCRVVFCNWPSQWVPSLHLGMHEILHGTWKMNLCPLAVQPEGSVTTS